MQVSPLSKNMFRIDLSKDELHVLHRCIIEAKELSDREFKIRVGATKDEISKLLDIIKQAVEDHPEQS